MFDPEKVERRNAMSTVKASDYDGLLELYKDAAYALEQHRNADNETWKHRERLQKLLPARYLGWHFTEAAADYIEKLHSEQGK